MAARIPHFQLAGLRQPWDRLLAAPIQAPNDPISSTVAILGTSDAVVTAHAPDCPEMARLHVAQVAFVVVAAEATVVTALQLYRT